MRNLFAFLTVLLFASTFYGQGEAPLSKGGKQLNFGLHSLDNGDLPAYVGLDFAVHDDVTLGPKITTNLFSGNASLKLGFVADYHWNKLIGIPNNWDFYAGLNAGYRIDFDVSGNSDLDFGGQVGGRWFFSEKWGLNAEMGFSGSVGGGVGMTMRF